jgi:uncharacterized YccA/Bax inhibitor family protein
MWFEASYPGIAIQAVAPTFGVLGVMLVLYTTRVIKVTQRFRTGVIVATLAIVAVAALNLLLDFDLIERGARSGAPAYMEWYAAFGLMVTLIWLYLEMLRLLGRLRR